jgi:hypothetical protein
MPKDTLSYKREDCYTLEEAAQIIGVVHGTMYRATSMGVLTTIRIKGEGQCLFLLKPEVEALRGSGEVSSKEARARVKAVQDASRDYVAEEHTYGEPLRVALKQELPAAIQNDDVIEKIASRLAPHLAPYLRETFREVLRSV